MQIGLALLPTERLLFHRCCCKVAWTQPQCVTIWGMTGYWTKKQNSPDAVVDDPMLLWHESCFTSKAAAA